MIGTAPSRSLNATEKLPAINPVGPSWSLNATAGRQSIMPGKPHYAGEAARLRIKGDVSSWSLKATSIGRKSKPTERRPLKLKLLTSGRLKVSTRREKPDVGPKRRKQPHCTSLWRKLAKSLNGTLMSKVKPSKSLVSHCSRRQLT